MRKERSLCLRPERICREEKKVLRSRKHEQKGMELEPAAPQ